MNELTTRVIFHCYRIRLYRLEIPGPGPGLATGLTGTKFKKIVGTTKSGPGPEKLMNKFSSIVTIFYA